MSPENHIVRRACPELPTLTTDIIMEKKIYNEALSYEAPELSATEISVEQGFAQSGIDFAFDAPDYEDGLTL